MEDNSLDEIFGEGNNNDNNSPNNKKPNVFKGTTAIIVVGVILALVGVFVIGFFVGQGQHNSGESFDSEQPLVTEIYDILKEHYIEDVSREEYETLFAAGFASVLDRYTGLMYTYGTPSTSNGAFGFTVQTDDNSVKTVVDVVEGGPSDGRLRRGDVLVEAKFDNKEMVNIEHLVFDKFKEKSLESKRVIFKVRRDGVIVDVPVISKGAIKSGSIAHYSDTPYAGFGYIKLNEFGEGAAASFMQALYEFSVSGNNILIMDVRGNPGGTNIELSRIVRNFIDVPTGKDMVINIKTRQSSQKTYAEKYSIRALDENTHESVTFDNNYIGDKIAKSTGKPFKLIVLANSMSASATEAFIGNIIHYMDTDDYMLIGESAHTFGKGIAQQDFRLKSNRQLTLHVTIGKYYVLGAKGTADESKEFTIHGVGYPLDNEGITTEIKYNIFDEDIVKKAVERASKWA